MKSPVVKRSIIIADHKTSVSLEDEFWQALKEIAADRGSSVSELVTSIDAGRRQGSLSSAIRVFVLKHYRDKFRDERAPAAAGERAASRATPSVLRAD